MEEHVTRSCLNKLTSSTVLVIVLFSIFAIYSIPVTKFIDFISIEEKGSYSVLYYDLYIVYASPNQISKDVYAASNLIEKNFFHNILNYDDLLVNSKNEPIYPDERYQANVSTIDIHHYVSEISLNSMLNNTQNSLVPGLDKAGVDFNTTNLISPEIDNLVTVPSLGNLSQLIPQIVNYTDPVRNTSSLGNLSQLIPQIVNYTDPVRNTSSLGNLSQLIPQIVNYTDPVRNTSSLGNLSQLIPQIVNYTDPVRNTSSLGNLSQLIPQDENNTLNRSPTMLNKSISESVVENNSGGSNDRSEIEDESEGNDTDMGEMGLEGILSQGLEDITANVTNNDSKSQDNLDTTIVESTTNEPQSVVENNSGGSNDRSEIEDESEGNDTDIGEMGLEGILSQGLEDITANVTNNDSKSQDNLDTTIVESTTNEPQSVVENNSGGSNDRSEIEDESEGNDTRDNNSGSNDRSEIEDESEGNDTRDNNSGSNDRSEIEDESEGNDTRDNNSGSNDRSEIEDESEGNDTRDNNSGSNDRSEIEDESEGNDTDIGEMGLEYLNTNSSVPLSVFGTKYYVLIYF